MSKTPTPVERVKIVIEAVEAIDKYESDYWQTLPNHQSRPQEKPETEHLGWVKRISERSQLINQVARALPGLLTLAK